MVIKKNFLKKYSALFISLGILITLSTLIHAVSDPGHSSDEILITINGYTMTLQEAIDGNYLVNELALPTQSLTTSKNPSHDANDLVISVNGQTKTLQDAVRGVTLQNKGLCSSFGTPVAAPAIGHLSTDVDTATISLQTKINNGDFCDPFTYKWVETSWSSCSASCGAGTQTRTYACKRYNGATLVGNAPSESYCYSESAYQTTIKGTGNCVSSTNTCTQSCDAGNTTCGWSSWTQTTTTTNADDCNATYSNLSNCGTGNLKRTRTCNSAGHCTGNNTDYGGSTCTETSGCNYQYVTLQSRIKDFASQCTNYYTKGWWWVKNIGSTRINPCTYLIGSGWGVSSVNPVGSGTGREYWCNVKCQKQIPSVETNILIGITRYEEIHQCLDYGGKWWWGMGSCPSGYTKVQYQLKDQSSEEPIACQTLCVKESLS